ncbi:MAG: HugZ family protein [Alphaproteobacteria bacterium]
MVQGAVTGRDDSPQNVARRLMRSATTAALATAVRDEAGWPYGSLVLLATDLDGTPLVFLSDLAEHSRNIAADERVSLLVRGGQEGEDPVAGPRLTLLGRANKSAVPRHRARFLARHPPARTYADFRDFHLYRVEVERAHLVAGFGRIHRLNGAEFVSDPAAAAALAACEAEVVAHMNADHGQALALYARAFLGVPGEAAEMTGIDPDGCDIRLGGRVHRLGFEEPVTDAASARATLAALVKEARRRLGERSI